jgi:plasmid stabilization system protein ParE
MERVELPLAKLTLAQKLDLIETLWDDIIKDEKALESRSPAGPGGREAIGSRLGGGEGKNQKERVVKVTILDPAERDLEEGYRFYERQSPGLGAYFLDSLYSDIDSLAYYGGIHSLVFGHHRLLSKRFPFAVYYRVLADDVVVTAVLDCRRNPSWIRQRLMPE